MTLAEFLLARIAEDEAAAPYVFQFTPARVLAECEAKRRIVEQAERHEMEWDFLVYLATVYADHPDYNEDWRVG